MSSKTNRASAITFIFQSISSGHNRIPLTGSNCMTTIALSTATNQYSLENSCPENFAGLFLNFCKSVWERFDGIKGKTKKAETEALGWGTTTPNPYIKVWEFFGELPIANIQLLDPQTLLSLAKDKYCAIHEALSEEQLTVPEVKALVKEINAETRKLKPPKIESGWISNPGGGGRKFRFVGELPGSTLQQEPGVAEWFANKTDYGKNVVGAILDLHKMEVQLSDRLKESEESPILQTSIPTFKVIAETMESDRVIESTTHCTSDFSADNSQVVAASEQPPGDSGKDGSRVSSERGGNPKECEFIRLQYYQP